MSKRQLDALMWAQACAAMERRPPAPPVFHHGAPYWKAGRVFGPVSADHPDRVAGVELETITSR